MKKYEFHPIANVFPLLPAAEIATLQADITANGLKTPIVLYENKILDGRNRYHACVSGSIEPTYTEYTGSNAATYVLSLNLHRRHLNASQLATVAVDFKPYLEKEAKERQQATLKQNKDRCGINSTTVKGKARDKAGELLNISGRYVDEAEKIKTEAPEVFEQIKNGEKTITEYNKEKKVAKRKASIELIKKTIATENKVITGTYDVVVIDPPWDYSEKEMQSCNDYDPGFNRKVMPYPTLSLKEISDVKLPLKDNAVVFLWTTHAFLHDSFHLLEKWGLVYKATMVWDKEKMGIGQNIRKQCEFCLLAVKGKPLIQGSSQRDIIRESRREHSRKPEAFYAMVEAITVGSRLDYFAREQRKGWSCFGAETNKF